MASSLAGFYEPLWNGLEKEDADSSLENNKGELRPSCHLCRCHFSTKKTFISWAFVIPWMLSIFFATLSIVVHLLHSSQSQSHLGSYDSGFVTDPDLKFQIPLKKVKFTGSPFFSSNGTPGLPLIDPSTSWPENMKYFGKPSPEIDENWQQLIGHRYFSISDEEAKRAWGDRRHDYVDELLGGYSAGFDMFHTLHCVNALRKALSPDYYPETVAAGVHGPKHTEHCLNLIRQTIQCYGSTTLIPTKFSVSIKHNYIDSDQEHVCRSFTFLRDYVTFRRHGNDSYVDRNQALINAENHKLFLEFQDSVVNPGEID